MPIHIDCDFPGGNIVVEHIHGDDVRLHQDLRDTARDWFYWCFRVRGAEERTLRFTFTRSLALGARGPAVSRDQGKTWGWLGGEAVNGNSFSYSFPRNPPEVRMSFGMPYQASDWQRFVRTISDSPFFSLHTLCTTAKHREVEYALLGRLDSEPAHRVAITCRHHCCEMMANDALEGLIQWVAEDSDSEAQWLRKNVQLFLVPFVDKDGVEEGDQGKDRRPRDHGRDYEGESRFASTNAIRRLLPGWGGDRLRVGIDLHCPWISGAHNEVIYLVGEPTDRMAEEQKRFAHILESVTDGPLPFLAEDFLPFGKLWNTSANYVGGKYFSRWVAELPGVVLGSIIEIPYANAHGAEVNQTSARRFGKDLGKGLAGYLRNINGKGHNKPGAGGA